MKQLQVLPLHRCKEYIGDCVSLLNSEWPRSETARLRSLNASCDTLPTSLIMVYSLPISSDNNDANTTSLSSNHDVIYNDEDKHKSHQPSSAFVVVGHSKISNLCSVQDACFIESVVIHKDYRGKGWGKYLMEQSELFIKTLGINIVYLTTVDKQGFYQRIGYVETEPVPIFGGLPLNINSPFKLLSISSLPANATETTPFNHAEKSCDSVSAELLSPKRPCSSAVDDTIEEMNGGFEESVSSVVDRLAPGSVSPKLLPPPPPPPPPPAPPLPSVVMGNRNNSNIVSSRGKHLNESKKTFMVKFI